jgi:tetratricopeptide (TPR) repeat protein
MQRRHVAQRAQTGSRRHVRTDEQTPLSLLRDAELAVRLDAVDEARRLLTALLDRSDSEGLRPRVLTALGHVALREGRPAAAARLYQSVLSANGTAGSVEAAEGLTHTLLAMGRPRRAIGAIRKLPPAVSAAMAGSLAATHAAALIELDAHAAAERVLARGLRDARERNDVTTHARLLTLRARSLWVRARLPEAQRWALRAVDALADGEDRYSLAEAKVTLAAIAVDRGRAEHALALLDDAESVLRSDGTWIDLAHVKLEQARALAAIGEPAAGRLAWAVAHELRHVHPPGEARSLGLLAELAEKDGDNLRAETLYRRALGAVEREPTRHTVAAYRSLARFYCRTGRVAEGVGLLELALDVQDRLAPTSAMGAGAGR